MTTIELASRVELMRDAQKFYFKHRTTEALEQSKRLERAVDKLVKDILDDRPAMLTFGDMDQ